LAKTVRDGFEIVPDLGVHGNDLFERTLGVDDDDGARNDADLLGNEPLLVERVDGLEEFERDDVLLGPASGFEALVRDFRLHAQVHWNRLNTKESSLNFEEEKTDWNN
jgi:hypothetical protein